MPFTPLYKNPGDLIKSNEWNEAMAEVVRLENEKMGRILGEPIAGHWYAKEQSKPGQNNYVWGENLLGSKPNFPPKTEQEDEIIIPTEGYYVINVNVRQSGTTEGDEGLVELRKNKTTIIIGSQGIFNKNLFIETSFSVIEFFTTGDKISVYQASPNALVFATNLKQGWWSLSIFKLN